MLALDSVLTWLAPRDEPSFSAVCLPPIIRTVLATGLGLGIVVSAGILALRQHHKATA